MEGKGSERGKTEALKPEEASSAKPLSTVIHFTINCTSLPLETLFSSPTSYTTEYRQGKNTESSATVQSSIIVSSIHRGFGLYHTRRAVGKMENVRMCMTIV